MALLIEHGDVYFWEVCVVGNGEVLCDVVDGVVGAWL